MCSVISPLYNRYPNRPYIQTDTTCVVSFNPPHNRYANRPYIQTDTTCAVSFHPPPKIVITADLTYKPIQYVQCHFSLLHNRYPSRPYIQTDTTYAVSFHPPQKISQQTLKSYRYNMCSVISPPTIDIPTDLTYRPIQHVQCHFTPPK